MVLQYLDFFSVAATSAVCCFILLLFFSTRTRNSHLLPWNWPFIKLMPIAYFRSHELYPRMTQVLAENKGTILLRTSFFNRLDILVTSDPANAQHVMSSNSSVYQRGSEFRRSFDFLGDAVFVKDIHEWKEGKKFTHGFYKENQFQNSIPKIIHHTLHKGLVPVLDHLSDHRQILDLQVLFNRYMLDSTCLLAAGFDLGSTRPGFPECPLLDAMDNMAEAVYWRNVLPESLWRMQKWMRIGKEKKMEKACVVLDRTLSEFVNNKYANEAKPDDFDVLQFYLDGSRGSTEKIGKTFLSANLMTLLFAGRDTSGAILTWFFHLISTNPAAKSKILEEIMQIAPPHKHLFSNVEQELSKLVYLHAALYESLRLFPPVPVLIRDPTQEDVLPSGHRVNRTTKIILCSYAMGRMEEIWGEDCGEFRPERWFSEKGGMKLKASQNFLAFGSGPWACPGRELAFARLKAVVATVLHNFEVDVVEGQTICPSVSALLTMKNGLKARVSSKWGA